RGLAGAVRPDQRMARAVRQAKVDPLGHAQRAEALLQPDRLQRRPGRAIPPARRAACYMPVADRSACYIPVADRSALRGAEPTRRGDARRRPFHLPGAGRIALTTRVAGRSTRRGAGRTALTTRVAGHSARRSVSETAGTIRVAGR